MSKLYCFASLAVDYFLFVQSFILIFAAKIEVMSWWYCLMGYYIICVVVGICAVLDDIKNNDDKDNWEAKDLILIFVLGPFRLTIGFIMAVTSIIGTSILEIIRDRREKYIFNTKYDFTPDEHYECFSMMGGAGVIVCEECGYQEQIVSFVHGFRRCVIGRQCPSCYAFVSETNESDKDSTFGKAKEDFKCPHCGTVIRKKEESFLKGNDDPLYCPKCHSHKLHYHCEYIT